MRNIYNLILTIVCVTLIACGDGNINNGTNYYSASYDTYYQIESNESSYTLNMVTATRSSLSSVPLTITSNGYTFSTVYQGQKATGNVVINNGQMGISLDASSSGFADFATINTNESPIPNGTYTTVCDQNNISACVITVNNNKISIIEYSVSAESIALCTNQTLTQVNNSINPNLFSFTCGVQAGTYSGTWYIMPLFVNNVTGFMISEYDASINANDDGTDEIAFPQAQFTPNGNYNYIYNAVGSAQSGISTASFNNSGIANNTVGTCAGAYCALITNQYTGVDTGNAMVGFDYYSVNGLVNYNLVGSNSMNIYQDSYTGFYF